MKHLLPQGSAHGTGAGSLRGWTSAAGSADERNLALVGQRMQMLQAPQPVPCRLFADPALLQWLAVTASAVCHGCAPPWRQVHHTPTADSQPAHSVLKLKPAGNLTLCGSKRTIGSTSLSEEAAMAEHDDDVALIRRWFRTLQVCIQTVDFAGSRPLFADDLITFGTYAAFTLGRAATEREQWRHVWGHIDRF